MPVGGHKQYPAPIEHEMAVVEALLVFIEGVMHFPEGTLGGRCAG